MVAAIGLAACAIAVVFDTALRRIPNWLTLPLLAAGPLLWLFHGPDGPIRAAGALVTVVIAMVVAQILHPMRILGGGDLKLLAALTGFLMPAMIPAFLCATAIAGGLLAIAISLSRRQFANVMRQSAFAVMGLAVSGRAVVAPSQVPARANIPYAWAIAAGFAFALFWRP